MFQPNTWIAAVKQGQMYEQQRKQAKIPRPVPTSYAVVRLAMLI